MSSNPARRKRFLFVDDDTGFLADLRQLFTEMSQGSWEIFTAENHSQALALLRGQSMDVVVLDLDMPVMDGLQFLRLLTRTYPGQQVVILTGQASGEKRQVCLDSGAALFLEKLITPEGFGAVFESLDLLAGAAPQDGFRGMMRRVGLQEVLQMECLGRKSSILEVFTGSVRGRIFVAEGDIIHAESGSLQGEMALYGLLGLRGGEFNLRPFSEPAQRTVSGHYEFLLMEAARLTDEGTNPLAAGASAPTVLEPLPEPQIVQDVPSQTEEFPQISVQIEEVLLASGSGTLLYERQCPDAQQRLNLLQQLEADAATLSRTLPAGRFDRVEIRTSTDRILCQAQAEMRLFVRSATLPHPDS
ncbi:MAG TPA: response regulator [Verrucomicrobiae bacterium]|nr:response regulator [Verrucomicrobiae bacterium]